MPFVTANSQRSAYDVIVVGSGAAGGQTAYTLCMDGAKVLMLEAGRNYSPATETPMFQTPELAPLRAISTPQKPFGFYDATVGGGWEVPGEPYVNASQEDAGRFAWWRARMLGGRTNHWGRIALRNGPYDFKPYTRDGLGFDWPIRYEDLAPYYDKVELLIGVFGSNEGLENTPDSPAGCLLPPPEPLVSDLLVAQRARRLGIPAIPGHKAVLTRPLDFRGSPARLHPGNVTAQRILADDMRSRAACIWATPCSRGCAIRANYQSTTVHLPPALASGNLDITTDAMVYEVTLARDGRANGVSFVDRTTGRQQHAAARVVVLAASACESARILLNSRSAQFPDGLANSSGRVGRYLMDTVGSSVQRADSAARESAAAQRGRRRWRSALCSLVAVPGAAGRQAAVRTRVPYRIRRRQAHAGVRNRDGTRMADRRQLRGEVQAGRAPLLRLFRLFRWPRRDDPQRSLLLRDRSRGRQRQVGHPGAALPLAMVGARGAPGCAHAKDLRGYHRRHGRANRTARCRQTVPRPSLPAA